MSAEIQETQHAFLVAWGWFASGVVRQEAARVGSAGWAWQALRRQLCLA